MRYARCPACPVYRARRVQAGGSPTPTHRRGISRDAEALKDMDAALGDPPVNIMDLYIDEMHDGSFIAYREELRE
jgi:hypothetical protein